MDTIRECPHRSPMVISDAVKDIINGKVVCDLGCGEGDNLAFMDRYAHKVIGFDCDPKRYQQAIDRGFEVVPGNYETDSLPKADVYYFWPDRGVKYNEFLVNKIQAIPGFNGTIIVAGDYGFRGEVESVEACGRRGRTMKVDFDEGPKRRQHGTFLLAIIECIGTNQAVFVLSSPRTGSSCLAACLSYCGASIGKHPVRAKTRHNPRGYFENQKMLDFHNKALKAVGSGIFVPDYPDLKQYSDITDMFPEFCRIFKTQFGHLDTILLKDPRIMILWPLYRRVLLDNNISPSFVMLHRDPVASARSVRKMVRGTISVERGVEIYHKYQEMGRTISKDWPTAEVSFDDIVSRHAEVFPQICSTVGLNCDDVALAKMAEFIDKKLVHFE